MFDLMEKRRGAFVEGEETVVVVVKMVTGR
jgi:hypothetical protein